MNLRRRDLLFYGMIPLLLVAALVQSTATVRAQVFGVKPDLVLLVVLGGTLIFGGRMGVVWAFMGGLALDLFSGGPLGASSLAMMAAALVVSPGHQTLSRFNVIVPMMAAALGTLVYGVTYLLILSALDVTVALPFWREAAAGIGQYGVPFWSSVQAVVMPSIAYNTLLMLIATPFLNLVPESHDVGV